MLSLAPNWKTSKAGTLPGLIVALSAVTEQILGLGFFVVFFFFLSMKNPWQYCSPGLTRSSAHLSWNYFFRFSLWQQDIIKHQEMQTMVRHEYKSETDKN